jgi:hypothetical protein
MEVIGIIGAFFAIYGRWTADKEIE